MCVCVCVCVCVCKSVKLWCFRVIKICSRCIPTLQVSCLCGVVVRAFDSTVWLRCVQYSNPKRAFKVGCYRGRLTRKLK